jgi:hypothetical protein
MAEFRVVIDGKLDAELERAINRSIQQAVLPHLSKVAWEEGDPLDPNDGRHPGWPHRRHGSGPISLFLPHEEWWGLVASGYVERVREIAASAE